MKAFFSTLSAILAAAAIICFSAFLYHSYEAKLKLDEEIRRMNLNTELRHARTEWDEQMTKNPKFDPNGEKLTARLQEIREASENDKPIPPSPWRMSETARTDDQRGAQSAPDTQPQPAVEIQPPASSVEYVVLNRDVEVSHGTNKIVIPKGSKLPVVSRGLRVVGVRFQDEQEIIPESATSESK